MMDPNEALEAARTMIPPDQTGSIMWWIIGTLAACVSALAAYWLKRNRAEIGAEDSLYNVSVATIKRQAAELAEKDAQMAALQREMATLHQQRNEADGRASRAAVAAENAQYMAEQCRLSADQARNEARQMQRERERDRAYIVQLRAALINAGIPVPPEPSL